VNSQTENGSITESLFQSLPIAVIVVENSKIAHISSEALALFGYESVTELSRSGVKKLFPAESHKKLLKAIQEHFDDKTLHIELRGVKKTGDIFDIQVAVTLNYSGDSNSQLFTFRDISTEKSTIGSLEEKALLFESLFTQSLQPLVAVKDGKVAFCNEAFRNFFFLANDLFLAEKDITDFIDPEKQSEFAGLAKKVLAGKLPSAEIEHKAYRGEGQFFDSKTKINLIHKKSEKLLLVSFTDITQIVIEKNELIAKANEWMNIDDIVSSLGEISVLSELIKALPEKLVNIIRFPNFAMYLTDAKSTCLEVQHHRGFGEEVLEKISILPFEEGIGAYLNKTLEPHCFETKQYPSFLPFRAVFKDGGFSKIAFIPFVSQGKLLGAIILAVKSTETEAPSTNLLTLLTKHAGETLSRVLSFEKLRTSEGAYRYSVENSESILYRLSSNGTFESFNYALEKLTGYNKQDFFRTSSLWLSLIHPDDKKFLLERQTLLNDLKELHIIEYRVRPKGKAAYRWVRDVLVPIISEFDATTRFEGTITDITEYKQGLLELTKEVEKQELEKSIADSNQMLNDVIDTMEDVLLVSSLEGNVLQINRAFETMLGYSFEEAQQFEFPQPWLNAEETGKYVLWMSELNANDRLIDFDMIWKSKEGTLFDVSISSTILRSLEGEPIALITVARDITERKRLSKELEERNSQVELLNRIMISAEQSLDFDEIFAKIAVELKKTTPFDDVNIMLLAEQGEMVEIYASNGLITDTRRMLIPLEQTFSHLTVRSQQPVIVSNLDEFPEYASMYSYSFGIRSIMSFPIVLKGQILGTMNIGSITPNTYHQVDTKSLQLVAQQLGVIIDRILLFHKVTEDAGYIHNLLDSIDNVVYTVDTDCRILEVNRAWTDFLRAYDVPLRDEYHGIHLFDVIPDETLKLLIQRVSGDILSGSVRYFSQEIVLHSKNGERYNQVTINPLVIERKITGLVIIHNDITELRRTALELKKYSDKLLTLNLISVLIQASKNINEILKTAIPMLQKAVEADALVVYLKDEISGNLTLSANSELDPQILEQVNRIPYDSTATGNVLKSRQSLFIQKRAYSDQRLLPHVRDIFRSNGVEALGIIPILSHDEIYGAMNVMYRTAQPFTDEISQILTLACNQLGSAIESVELYNQLQRQIDQLSIMYQLGQQFTSTLEIEKIFEIVVEQVKKAIPFENLSIGLYDEKNSELEIVMEVGSFHGNVQIFSKTVEKSIISSASSEWQTIITKRTSIQNEGSLFLIPMLSKEKIIGIMAVTQTGEKSYSPEQVRLLESIANLLAIALEKGKLYQETIQKTAEIERRNRELDDFTYVVSHDLKEPLISIEGFSRILESDFGASIEGEGHEYLDSIVAASGRMKGLIDDLLNLSRVSKPREAFKPVSLDEIVNEVRSDVEFSLIKKDALLVIEDPLPVVIGNRSHLKILFQNLISNAIKFNDKERPVIEVGFQNTENNSYLFFVRDNGIGIEKDFQEKIFIIFQRLHRREEYEGSGAGLAIVKKIVEIHNGTIWVESVPGQGSTFYFTLPK